MEVSKSIYVTNRDDWREWLKKNHASEKGIWLIYYKKHTGKSRIAYGDAVEEALCFGWIDSTIKRIDDEKYAQKFTPRKGKSRWSALNKRRVRKMMREGRMTEAGLAKVKGVDLSDKREVKPSKRRLSIPPDVREALAENKKVWDNFSNLAFSYKRQYIGWITSAKKDETKKRRLKEAIGLLAQNKKLGMK